MKDTFGDNLLPNIKLKNKITLGETEIWWHREGILPYLTADSILQ